MCISRLVQTASLGGTWEHSANKQPKCDFTSEGRGFSTSLVYNTSEIGMLSRKIKTGVSNQSEEMEMVSSPSQQNSHGSLDTPRKTMSTLMRSL